MGAHDFKDLMNHYGHKIVVVVYGKREQYGPDPADTVKEACNVAIECETCSEVLLDFDRHPEDEEVTPSEELLLSLLAVIHRDGGQYTAEHGLQRSVGTAMAEVLKWIQGPSEELSAEDAGTKLIGRWGKAQDLLDDLLKMVSDPGDLADERWTTGLKQVLQQVKELVG